jgi:hypothetical protein
VELPEPSASSSSSLTGSRAQALGAGRRPGTCPSPSSSGLSRRTVKGSPRQSTARRWTGRPLSRGSTWPEGQSLASGSMWPLHKPQVVLNGEEVPDVPPPPGVHPPQTVWTEIFSSCSSSSEQEEGVQPDGLKTLPFNPHPTPETSSKENKEINESKEQKESLENENLVKEKENERKVRKISQEDRNQVRKISRKKEEDRRNIYPHIYPHLQVPRPEARHAIVSAPWAGSRTLGQLSSSSSSSPGGQPGASEITIGKNKGDAGALGQGNLQGGEYLDINTLYGGDSCQTLAAHNCAAAVPPIGNISNLGLRKTTNMGFGQNIEQQARNRNCGTPRGITDNIRPGGE